MAVGHYLPGLDSPWRRGLSHLGEGTLSDLRTFALAKSYDTTEALGGIDLEVPAGIVDGLVGPNGSGKTTALEILAGLRHPDAGRVELGVAQDLVAYCPDEGEFEPWLTALEVLEVAAGLLGRPRSHAELAEMLDQVGLSDSAGRRVGGFSRGMRSRLGLAAGLIGGPKVLIADEPAAALDPAGRWEIIDLLAAAAGPLTVLVSSHDLADVERVCDRIGVLAKGRLVYQGALADLLALGGPSLRVVVRPPADRLVLGLRGTDWARTVVEGEPGEIVVEVSDREAAEVELPEIIAASRVRLVEVGRAGANLQDIFFRLTETGPYRETGPAGQ